MKTLSKYIEELQQVLITEGDLPCYYARDDEGNGYQEVFYAPSVFYVERLEHRLEDVYSDEDRDGDDPNLKPICVVN